MLFTRATTKITVRADVNFKTGSCNHSGNGSGGNNGGDRTNWG